MKSKTIKYPAVNTYETGKNIARICEENGLTIRDIAILLNVSRQSVYKWFNGKCLPSLDNLLILSHLFDMSLHDILVCDAKEEIYPEGEYVFLNTKNYVREGNFQYTLRGKRRKG